VAAFGGEYVRRRVLIAIAVMLGALVVGLLIFGTRRSERMTTTTGVKAQSPFLVANALPHGLGGRPAPRFALADARGGMLTNASLHGRPYVITFLYTNCPDVCPLIGEELRAALAGLGGDARKLGVVGVSVDPRGDSAQAARGWLRVHREPSNFHYLIGSEARLAPLWSAYSAAPQIPGDPQSSHTAAIWLVDKRGRLVALVDAGIAIDVGKLTHDLRVLVHTT
jgi:protein SCO1/2